MMLRLILTMIDPDFQMPPALLLRIKEISHMKVCLPFWPRFAVCSSVFAVLISLSEALHVPCVAVFACL